MALIRAVVFVILLTTVVCSAALAQRPGPQFRRELACEPFEPRTKLEAVESRYEKILIKGFSQVANLNVRGVLVRIDAVEMKDSSSPLRATGIVISLRGGGEPPRENRSYIDYEEIDSLLKAIGVGSSCERIGNQASQLRSSLSHRGRFRGHRVQAGPGQRYGGLNIERDMRKSYGAPYAR